MRSLCPGLIRDGRRVPTKSSAVAIPSWETASSPCTDRQRHGPGTVKDTSGAVCPEPGSCCYKTDTNRRLKRSPPRWFSTAFLPWDRELQALRVGRGDGVLGGRPDSPGRPDRNVRSGDKGRSSANADHGGGRNHPSGDDGHATIANTLEPPGSSSCRSTEFLPESGREHDSRPGGIGFAASRQRQARRFHGVPPGWRCPGESRHRRAPEASSGNGFIQEFSVETSGSSAG